MRRIVSVKTRLLSLLLAAVMLIGVMPISAFAGEVQKKKIVGIEEEQLTERVVSFGTSKEDVGLPSELFVTIETEKSEAEGTAIVERSEETAAVDWKGKYDGNIAGEYILTGWK